MNVMNMSKVNQSGRSTTLLSLIIKFENGVEKLLSLGAVIGIVSLCFVVMLQIFGRLFLDTPPVWTEELARYLFIGTVSISVGIAYKRGELVSVELLYNVLSKRNAHIFTAAVSVIIFTFGWILYPSAMQFMQIGEFQTSPTMFFPMNYVFASTVVILLNLMLFSALSFLKSILSILNSGDA